MNNLSLLTKIRIDSMPYGNFKYLKIKKRKFFIYNNKEILLFNKNLSYKKIILPFDKDEIHIQFIKKISYGKFLCGNNKNMFIFTIEPEIKIIKNFKIENQWIRNAIELKNGIILTITNNSIFKIILNDNNKDEINEIFRIPDKCKVKNIKNKMDINLSFDIYNLPNHDNTILINSYSLGTYYQAEECVHGIEYYSKSMMFTFNVNKCKIIDYIKILENDSFNINRYTQLTIIINNKYIIASNNNNKIYIFNIFDYKLIRELDIYNYKIWNFDENKFFIFRTFGNKIDLYDITNIKYQNVEIKEIINSEDLYNEVIIKNFVIKKFYDDKILYSKGNYLFIIKYI